MSQKIVFNGKCHGSMQFCVQYLRFMFKGYKEKIFDCHIEFTIVLTVSTIITANKGTGITTQTNLNYTNTQTICI